MPRKVVTAPNKELAAKAGDRATVDAKVLVVTWESQDLVAASDGDDLITHVAEAGTKIHPYG